MKKRRNPSNITHAFLPLVFLFVFLVAASASSYPVEFTDDAGNTITITKRPSRVVSLVPSITEIILRIGAGDAVKAVTYHDTYPAEVSEKKIVGGFFSPCVSRIEGMNPDVIFLSSLQEKVKERFGDGKCILINLETGSIEDSFRNILLLGRIFEREDRAAEIINEIKDELRIIGEKVGKIPRSERKRVIRLMGRDTVMTPGDDSFQNEMIRAAGCIPPALNKKGNIVVITKEEWIRFNPQVIYGCGGDRETARKFFEQPGWRDVAAVENGKIFYFPCVLTCRAATNTGYFISWLSSRIYEDEYSIEADQVKKDAVIKSRSIEINLDYVEDARVAYSTIRDFPNKTLIIDFKKPLRVVSTLEGELEGITSVGNHYSSPPCWGIGHKEGLKKIRSRIYEVIGKSGDTASFLFTGADMDNLAIKREVFKEMEVYAFVTAGVKSNAVRMSKDEGRFYEPGTINIILLPNMKLTSRAMTRAVISATEAKTAALMDMDIRSSYSPQFHRATGTGTDNIIVAQGRGVNIDNAGGHSKMGELIAKAVYEGVREAVRRQNGLTVGRNVFQRLKDRRISIYGLISGVDCECNQKKSNLARAVEEILLDPSYAGFVESAFPLSDDYERGLVKDIFAYELWCKTMAEDIAGKKIVELKGLVETDGIPVVLRMALNAIVNGAYSRNR